MNKKPEEKIKIDVFEIKFDELLNLFGGVDSIYALRVVTLPHNVDKYISGKNTPEIINGLSQLIFEDILSKEEEAWRVQTHGPFKVGIHDNSIIFGERFIISGVKFSLILTIGNFLIIVPDEKSTHDAGLSLRSCDVILINKMTVTKSYELNFISLEKDGSKILKSILKEIND